MKNKALFVFFFGIVLSLMINSKSYASWPVAVAPAIEGQVLDTTTGEPIENAIIEVTWQTSVYVVVDRSSGKAGYKLIATGKDGKYNIPSKIMLQPLGGFFSSFAGVIIVVRHPLYESKNMNYWRSSIGGDRIIKEDIKLLSLEEKYPKSTDTYNIHRLSEEMSLNYYRLAYKMNILSKLNINELINQLDIMISKYSEEDKIYLKVNIDAIKKFYAEKDLKISE